MQHDMACHVGTACVTQFFRMRKRQCPSSNRCNSLVPVLVDDEVELEVLGTHRPEVIEDWGQRGCG